MSAKISVAALLEHQLHTFQGYDRKTQLVDLLVFIGVPLAGGATLAFFGPDIRGLGSVLGGVGVLTALLFALLVNVFNLSVKLRRDEGLRPEQNLARNIDELFANVSWAVLVGLALVLVMLSAAVTHAADQRIGAPWILPASGLFFHLIVIVIMALVRIVSAYDAINELAPKRQSSGGSDSDTPAPERNRGHAA